MRKELPDFSLPDWFDNVYAVVRLIPTGHVATYGLIADAVSGVSITARQVGAAMRFAPDDIPWHRVVGAHGVLPIARRSPELHRMQRSLLEAEGVAFGGRSNSTINMALSQHRWIG